MDPKAALVFGGAFLAWYFYLTQGSVAAAVVGRHDPSIDAEAWQKTKERMRENGLGGF